jgi:hypothetical protein
MSNACHGTFTATEGHDVPTTNRVNNHTLPTQFVQGTAHFTPDHFDAVTAIDDFHNRSMQFWDSDARVRVARHVLGELPDPLRRDHFPKCHVLKTWHRLIWLNRTERQELANFRIPETVDAHKRRLKSVLICRTGRRSDRETRPGDSKPPQNP